MIVKNILNVVPTIHAASLAGSIAKDAKKKDKGVGDIVGSASKALIGIPLIKLESNLIAAL